MRKSIIDKEAAKRYLIMTDNKGVPTQVLRPATEELKQTAIILAKIAADKQDKELFDRIPSEINDYIFAGYLAVGPDGIIVDIDGKEIDRVQPGDSFATPRIAPKPSN